MVGLLHSMTASGRPLTNTTTSGRMCFFDPSTLYCRVTIHSLRRLARVAPDVEQPLQLFSIPALHRRFAPQGRKQKSDSAPPPTTR